ncbi:MAG TPA: polymer-forming cytoskeletal protein, partial [Steroidobacteraceae bacterium]|nr:polymer-forming cytoskeletal protein [Steroidobacteraceae bacterium]
GKVKANINAQVIKVEGTVEGDLHAERSVYVDESGNLRGNIHAPSVCLIEGSKFNGAVDMDGKKGAQHARPDTKANRPATPAQPKTGT